MESQFFLDFDLLNIKKLGWSLNFFRFRFIEIYKKIRIEYQLLIT
jgi:hypothetical protein